MADETEEKILYPYVTAKQKVAVRTLPHICIETLVSFMIIFPFSFIFKLKSLQGQELAGFDNRLIVWVVFCFHVKQSIFAAIAARMINIIDDFLNKLGLSTNQLTEHL